ncbi:MAG: segregation and condensation protein A [Culicoidibacterales bacterium]
MAAEKTADYIVQLEQFEGPMDVLLHLVQKAKVNIMDISIADITEQYIAYIESLRKLNLEVAADYLLMSARLIEIKSRMLLPRLQEEEGMEVDPKQELIERLLEYKKYKDIVSTFREFEFERKQVYSKSFSDISDWIQDETVLNTENKKDVYQLVKVFEKMLTRQTLVSHQSATMKRQEITIEEQIEHIEQRLINERVVKLTSIVENKETSYIVTTFLALLQLARIQKISVTQDENFSDILLELMDEASMYK